MNASMLRREIETLLGLNQMDAAVLWRAAATAGPPALPPGPVPVPLPNIATSKPVNVQGAGSRFDGKYMVTGVQHQYGKGGQKDLFECVRAAAAGDQAVQRNWNLWLRVRDEIGKLPPQARQQLGHELVHTVQQRGRN